MIFKGDFRDGSEGNEKHGDTVFFLEEAWIIDHYNQNTGRQMNNRSFSNKFSCRNGKRAT